LSTRELRGDGFGGGRGEKRQEDRQLRIQGNLAHKKQPHSRNLHEDYA
jgi:hypothetical protein